MPPSKPLSASLVAKSLGYGGLIPFIAYATLPWIDRVHLLQWNGFLILYGGLILTFVGAIHWGVAMTGGRLTEVKRRALFTWSVVPSLLAFAAIAVNSRASNIMLICGFLIHYVMDLRIAKSAALPDWYLPLRLRLSLIASICLAASELAIAL